MKRPLLILLSLCGVVFAAVAGFYGYRAFNTAGGYAPAQRTPKGPDMQSVRGTMRPDFTLKGLDGKTHDIAEWNGKVVVLNFWATWCPPCRKEIPSFIDLEKKYGARGVQFVGVAVDDPKAVRPYIEKMGVNYPILIGDNDKTIRISKEYGNRLGALPYTVLINRDGHIVYARRGEWDRKDAENAIRGLL